MIAPARSAAYDVLRKVSTGRLDLASAVADARQSLEDDRDRALASEIATGVQRWRASLDHLIATFSKRSLDRLDPEVVEILRLSIYQLLHLTRVPAAAVVNDAVSLTGRVGKRSAAGLVNAVLRTLSRRRQALPLPTADRHSSREQVLDYFSITLSHPRWLAARWYDRLGFEAAERWFQFNNRAAPLTLRANRLRVAPPQLAETLAAADVETVRGRYAPDALIVAAGHPLRHPGSESGLFVVQDEASQLVTFLAGERRGSHVLDTCASPGGKTTALAASVAPEGKVVACDVRDRRMELLRRTVRASGAANVLLVQADLRFDLPFLASFDRVMVDAPCSGLGTLRRDPDIKWRRQDRDLAVLAESQRVMLRHAAAVVGPGGHLIYATCSSEPEENEEIVDAFLSESAQFEPVDARVVHPSLPADVVDERGHLRTLPHVHDLEAFFGAVLRRR
jgi:16S rRNA (cytosine967-C5)-methyltransferase